jgi:DNA invertase Pin-like site-specific DNA recombinase
MMSRKYDVRTFPARELVRRFDQNASVITIASALETKRSTVYKWFKNDTMITQWAADRYAVKLGLHPCEVWDDWFALEAV